MVDIPKIRSLIDDTLLAEKLRFLKFYHRVVKKLAQLAGIEGARNLAKDILRAIVDWEMNSETQLNFFAVENKLEISELICAHFGFEEKIKPIRGQEEDF
jgi:hypothetical protein